MSTSVAKTGAGHGIGGDFNAISSRGSAMYVSNADTRIMQLVVEQAEVIDINLTDADQMGKIQARPMNAKGRDASSVNTAWPMSSNIRVYPVIGETVATFNFFGTYFYIYPLNSLNYINNNSLSNVTQKSQINSSKQNGAQYQATLNSRMPNSTADNSSQTAIGDYIINQKENIPILKPNEGDVILEGRVGNCIRFGYNKDTNLPNVKMSLLSRVEKPYVSIVENLNDDNCIWITSDEALQFTKPDTKIDSKNNPTEKYDGEQVILSSDRLIFSSKKNEIVLFSNKGIYNACDNNFGVDAGDAIVLNSQNNTQITSKQGQIILKSSSGTIIDAPNIYLGSKDAKEPLVLGNKIVQLLNELITAILAATYPTAGGPSGTAINSADFNRVQQKIQEILSKQNFTK